MAMQALVMGFGGTGAHVLTALKELAVLKYGKMPESIKFLLFDTIADWAPGKGVPILGGAAEEKIAEGKEAATSLDKNTEYFHLADHDPDLKRYVFDYLNLDGDPERYPHFKDWLHSYWLSEHIPENRLNVTDGAAQQRQIGRFVMFQNADKIIEKLRTDISKLSREALGTGVNVWIVGSSAGGTGAGCLLDAGYMTRLAAGNIDINLTGVIVLPEVYDGVEGISKARAYSLFRELNRVQELGIPQRDRYTESSSVVSTRVLYDSRNQNNALVKGRLFDDLFYLGKACFDAIERESFFTSAANAIDPYLDASSGPVLLQASVNTAAVASSFGAARLYVPVETLADLFAWEQVEIYLKRATAPKEEERLIVDLHHGAEDDRRSRAKERTERLLNLFGELLQRSDKAENENRTWVKNALDPEKIVETWYQFAATSLAGETLSSAESQTVKLAYIDPYKSFIYTDDNKIPPNELETKTWKENKDAKGVKESYEESRERFAKRLEALTQMYTTPGGGERSFSKGRNMVKEKVSNRLRNHVDNIIINEITQDRTFSFDPNNESQGTPLTRLYREINYVISEPLRRIDATISVFINTLNEEEAQRVQQPVNTLKELRDSKKGGVFDFGNWVESYQQSARDDLSEYIRWYQKRELLKDMQEIVRNVSQRFDLWRKVLSGVFDNLTLDGTGSALIVTRRDKIDALRQRLNRAAKNPTARISLTDNDDQMDGYVNVLRQQSVRTVANETLVDKLIANSHWEAEIAQQGVPGLKLIIKDFKGQDKYSRDDIRDLSQDLYNYFHEQIRETLQNTDIFDYLIYLRQARSLTPDAIASKLREGADILLRATGKEESRLVYKAPVSVEKSDLAGLIQASLARLDSGTKDPEKSHSDASSITLLKVKKPNTDDIQNINDCELVYKNLLAVARENYEDPKELLRAQVYHPFRAELEAWYIERHYWRQRNNQPNMLMPARIVRLLENPEMMQSFVQGIAAGAIENVEDNWVWHHTRPVMLTDYDKDGDNADLMSAAVTFVLQQRERVQGSLQSISRHDAKQSIAKAAEKQQKTVKELLIEFKNNKLNAFVIDNLRMLRPEEQEAFKIILDFYCDPGTRTTLQHRMDLEPN